MYDTISNAASKLSEITAKTPVDWDAFDAVIRELDDINVYDAQNEETILTEFIMDGGFLGRGELLIEAIRHFLACGYDVSANEGLNGGLALSALCWSSYDRHVLDAARVLMNAGAPVNFRTVDDDPNDEPEGLLGDIGWKLSGAWMADRDFALANILEAYYVMTEANLAGKDYTSIDTYFPCLGKPLTAISAVKSGNTAAIKSEGTISVFSEPLVLWFEDKPLVASCYTDFVVNPVYVGDNKANLSDVTAVFSSLVGTTLQKIQYVDTTICYFEFSNGQRLFFASRNIGNRKWVGSFELRTADGEVNIEKLNVNCLCGTNGRTYANDVTTYIEDSLALFSDDTAYLLYLRQGTHDKYRLGICQCARELLTEYRRQYPLKSPSQISCTYEQNNLQAIRLDYPEGYLYIVATGFYEMELQLSEKLYEPLAYSSLPSPLGKHIEFLKRKE